MTEAKAPVCTLTPIHVPPLGILVSIAHNKCASLFEEVAEEEGEEAMGKACGEDDELGDVGEEVGGSGTPLAPKSVNFDVERVTYSSRLFSIMMGKRRQAPVAIVSKHISMLYNLINSVLVYTDVSFRALFEVLTFPCRMFLCAAF